MEKAPYSPRDRERFVVETHRPTYRSEFERDRGRIMYSSALRRLGAKTQVLGAATDDFVRTRLTHSLEVAQVGRSIAQNLGCDPDVVDGACQAHDLGHPPFGHNGEKALNELARDIGGFEGNAQTFRLLTRLEPKASSLDGSPVGLNLTRASLDAVCKYPWLRGEGGPKSHSKYNCYPEDEEIFRWVRAYSPGLTRCLEAQIMDISDDISYSVHDVEDAIVTFALNPSQLYDEAARENIYRVCHEWYGPKVSFDELEAAWERLECSGAWIREFTGTYADHARLRGMTSEITGRFCTAVTEATLAQGPGPLHRYDCDLVVPPSTLAEIMLLKGTAVAYVMAPRELEPRYMDQRSVLFELFDTLQENPRHLEPLYWENYAEAQTDAGRVRAVIDQLAALTDLSAYSWHARLRGMLSS